MWWGPDEKSAKVRGSQDDDVVRVLRLYLAADRLRSGRVEGKETVEV